MTLRPLQETGDRHSQPLLGNLHLSFAWRLGGGSKPEDFPPKAQCKTCPQPAATPARPSVINRKVPRPVAWRVGRRERRTLSSSPSEEEAPHTSTSP